MNDDEHAVLADELMQRNDPHGELIALQASLEDLPETALPARRRVLESRIAAHLERHHDTLFGDLAPHVQRASRPDLSDPALVAERWTRGFVDVAIQQRKSGLDLADITRALRSAPIGRFVRRLQIRHGDQMGAARELVRDPFPALRELTVGPVRGTPGVGSIEILSPLADELDVLELLMPARYSRLESRRIQKLVLWEHADHPVRFDARLDAIEDLRLSSFHIDRGLVQRYPTLRHVELASTFETGWLEHFLGSDLGRLEQVSLYDSSFREPDLDVLVRYAERLAGIELDLSTPWGNLSSAARDAARARIPPNIRIR